MKKLLISFLLVLTFSCNNNKVDTYNPYLENYDTRIEFSMNKGLPIAELLLNGRKVKFLIDSGASSSVLNLSYADALGFDYELVENFNFTGVSGRVIQSGIASKAVLRTVDGDRLFVDFKVLDMNEVSQSLRIVGIIGSDYLDRFNYCIDYKYNVIKK